MTTPKRPDQLDSPLLPVIFRYATRAQVWIYRRTGGKVGGKWRIGAGFRKPVPTLLLEHRVRKSGKLFITSMLYLHDDLNVNVVASQDGRSDNRRWYRILIANPDTHIKIGPERSAVHTVYGGAGPNGRGCGRGWSRSKLFLTPLNHKHDRPERDRRRVAGARRTHQWYRNLVANPDTHIEIGAERRAVHAETAGRAGTGGCGRGWSRRTPISTPTRAGPTVRFP